MEGIITDGASVALLRFEAWAFPNRPSPAAHWKRPYLVVTLIHPGNPTLQYHKPLPRDCLCLVVSTDLNFIGSQWLWL